MDRNLSTGGGVDVDAETAVTPERRRALRRELVAVATSTRELLPDEFVVGGEISGDPDALHATVAVQPPAGSVVSAGFDPDGDEDAATLARDLAASAFLEARHAVRDVDRTAR